MSKIFINPKHVETICLILTGLEGDMYWFLKTDDFNRIDYSYEPKDSTIAAYTQVYFLMSMDLQDHLPKDVQTSIVPLLEGVVLDCDEGRMEQVLTIFSEIIEEGAQLEVDTIPYLVSLFYRAIRINFPKYVVCEIGLSVAYAAQQSCPTAACETEVYDYTKIGMETYLKAVKQYFIPMLQSHFKKEMNEQSVANTSQVFLYLLLGLDKYLLFEDQQFVLMIKSVLSGPMNGTLRALKAMAEVMLVREATVNDVFPQILGAYYIAYRAAFPMATPINVVA